MCRQAKNGRAEEESWCDTEFQDEVGEESVKVGWTRGHVGYNGKGKVDEVSGCYDNGG